MTNDMDRIHISLFLENILHLNETILLGVDEICRKGGVYFIAYSLVIIDAAVDEHDFFARSRCLKKS